MTSPRLGSNIQETGKGGIYEERIDCDGMFCFTIFGMRG